VWPEQGYGDQIMFARFIPWLKAQAAEVTLICRPGLERLLGSSLEVRALPAAGTVDFGEPDYWVSIADLAPRFGLTLETIPSAPYLRPPGSWSDLGPGFKVGLKTVGNPEYLNDAHRSLTPDATEALQNLPARMISLEPAHTGARDFAETAAIVDQLDLVISVDTSVAHLAGALGKPCWILLSAIHTDWRWMRDRRDSPWYPTVRLYRQTTPGDWSAVIGEIRRDLAALNP
jgi:hypothetical protein